MGERLRVCRCGRAVRGQATLEYLVCLAAFMAMVLALAALWHASRDGVLVRIALRAASHTPLDAVGFAKDLALY